MPPNWSISPERISACRVVVDCVHRQNHVGRLYQVHLVLTVPGGTVMVNREATNNHVHDDLQVAIRDAFEAARRQLQGRLRRMEGAEKRRLS